MKSVFNKSGTSLGLALITAITVSACSNSKSNDPAAPTQAIAPVATNPATPENKPLAMDEVRSKVVNAINTTTPTPAPSPTIGLDEVLQSVLADHPDVLAAQSRVKENQYYVANAKLKIFPSIEATAQANNTDTGITTQGYYVGFQTVLWDGTYTALVKQSIFRQISAEQSLRAVVRALTVGTYQKYLALIKTQGLVASAKSQFEVVSNIYDQIRAAWVMGLASNQLVYEAEAEMRKANLAYTDAQAQSKIACLNLLMLIPSTDTKRCVHPADVAAPTFNVPADPAEAITLALKNRPEMAIDLSLVEMAKLGKALARAEYYPKVVLQAQYGYSNSPNYGGGVTGPTTGPNPFDKDYSVGVVIKIPIFDGGKKKNDMKAALEKLNQAMYAAELTKRNISEDVMAQLISIETAKLGVETAMAGELAARNLYNDSLVAYGFGSLGLTDLLMRISSLSKAEQSTLEAKSNLVQALISLKTSLGIEN